MLDKIIVILNKETHGTLKFHSWKTYDADNYLATRRLNTSLMDLDNIGKFGALFKLYSLWIRAAYFDDMVYYQDAWEVFGKNYAKVHNLEVTLRIGLGPDDKTGVLKLTYLRQLSDKSVVEETLFEFIGSGQIVDTHLKILRDLIPGIKTGPANVEI
jgi:hypothetical protein